MKCANCPVVKSPKILNPSVKHYKQMVLFLPKHKSTKSLLSNQLWVGHPCLLLGQTEGKVVFKIKNWLPVFNHLDMDERGGKQGQGELAIGCGPWRGP